MKGGFSWQKSIKRAEQHKIREAITLSKNNLDFKLKHPGEVRDSETKNYVVLTKRIKDEHQKHLKLAMDRRNKNA